MIAAPLLAIAGSIAVWFRPHLSRLTLWGATAAWLSFGVAVAGLNWSGGLGLRDVLAIALLMIVPAALLVGAALAAAKVCKQMPAAVTESRSRPSDLLCRLEFLAAAQHQINGGDNENC